MDVVGAFIGVDRLKILGVPHHIVLGRDTVTAQHVPGDARDVQRLAAVVALYERDRLRNKNALVHPAADAKRGLQSERPEERRVGKEGASTCRARWWPYN